VGPARPGARTDSRCPWVNKRGRKYVSLKDKGGEKKLYTFPQTIKGKRRRSKSDREEEPTSKGEAARGHGVAGVP